MNISNPSHTTAALKLELMNTRDTDFMACLLAIESERCRAIRLLTHGVAFLLFTSFSLLELPETASAQTNDAVSATGGAFLFSTGMLFCVVFGLIAVRMYSSYRRIVLATGIHDRLQVVEAAVTEYETRAQIVANIAADYFLTLQGEGTASVIEIRQQLFGVRHSCREVSELLQESTWHSLVAANQRIAELDNWQLGLERSLQLFGRKIVRAANAGTSGAGHFRRRTAKNFIRLSSAGIAAPYAAAA